MITPPALNHGDKVMIVSPSRQIGTNDLDAAISLLKSWTLQPVLGESVFDRHGYFAGDDQSRLNDLQQGIDDQEIKAIFCARGGYGLTRIIDQLNLKNLIDHSKWLIGFSDITALHLKCIQQGIESIHGVMPVQYGHYDIGSSLASLKQILWGERFNLKWTMHEKNITGKCQGQIVGGNLSLLVESLGTPTEIDTHGRILFIEEIDEYYYKIDRMLNQLKRAKKFDNLEGLIIGQFTGIKDTQISFSKSLYDLILNLMDGYNFPITFGAEIGHEIPNYAIPIGRELQLNVATHEATLTD